MKDYFDSGVSSAAPAKAPVQAALSDNDGDEQSAPVATITVTKNPAGGFSASFDSGDEQSEDFGSIGELCQSLEEKYGEAPKEDSAAPAAPAKSSGYMDKVIGSKES